MISSQAIQHSTVPMGLVANGGRFASLKASSVMPLAFYEYRAPMAAPVLNARCALDLSVFIVRAFVQLRGTLASHQELARKMAAPVRKFDSQIKAVFDAIRERMESLVPKQKPIDSRP